MRFWNDFDENLCFEHQFQNFVFELLGHDEGEQEEGGVSACDREQVHLSQVETVVAGEARTVNGRLDNLI